MRHLLCFFAFLAPLCSSAHYLPSYDYGQLIAKADCIAIVHIDKIEPSKLYQYQHRATVKHLIKGQRHAGDELVFVSSQSAPLMLGRTYLIACHSKDTWAKGLSDAELSARKIKQESFGYLVMHQYGSLFESPVYAGIEYLKSAEDKLSYLWKKHSMQLHMDSEGYARIAKELATGIDAEAQIAAFNCLDEYKVPQMKFKNTPMARVLDVLAQINTEVTIERDVLGNRVHSEVQFECSNGIRELKVNYSANDVSPYTVFKALTEKYRLAYSVKERDVNVYLIIVFPAADDPRQKKRQAP